jgi:hypothetical protein
MAVIDEYVLKRLREFSAPDADYRLRASNEDVRILLARYDELEWIVSELRQKPPSLS